MSLLVFVAVATLGIAGLVVVRGRTDAVRVVGAIALAACLVAAVILAPGSELFLGRSGLVVTRFAHLWLVAASGAFLFLHLLGVGTIWQRNLPLVMLAVLATSALALTARDAVSGLLMAVTGGLIAILGALLLPLTASAIQVAADGLRVAAIAAALGVIASGWIDSTVAARAPDAFIVGFALIAAATAVRFGAFPLHAPAARVTQTAPLIAAPVLLAWVPAVFAAIALSWHETRLLPLGTDAGGAGTAVIGLAILTIALAGLAAAVQDDVAQIVGYSTIQDGAFVLLALAAPAEASAAVRGWLIVFVLVKSAAFGLALTLSAAFGTRLVTDLHGWVRRSPLLGAALLAIAIATYGWPGLVPWEARAAVLRPALGALWPAAMALAVLPLLPLARLGRVGLLEQGVAVRRGFGSRPAPVPFARRGFSRPSLARGYLRASAWEVLGAIRGELADALAYISLAWRLNRAPAAAVFVLVLALLPLGLAFRPQLSTAPATQSALSVPGAESPAP